MNEVLLGVGSNVNPEWHIPAGLLALGDLLGEIDVSPVFRSAAVGFEGDPFLNLVVRGWTTLSLADLQQDVRMIERSFGRLPDQPKFSARALDIDILCYGDRVGVFDGITLPRGEILENAFVLWPLAELVPEHCHPATGVTYAQLWRDFDKGGQMIEPVTLVMPAIEQV